MSPNEGMLPRSRKQPSMDGGTLATQGHAPLTTFFLRREGEMQHGQHQDQDSTFGVQSLEDTLDAAFAPNSPNGPPSPPAAVTGKKRKVGNPVHPKIAAAAHRIISSERPSSRTSSHSPAVPRALSQSPSRRPARSESSTSFTPLRFCPTPDGLLPSTPRSGSVRSVRLSDEEGSLVDDTASQAIHSSSEDEETTGEDTLVEQSPSSIPQLVMPSIAMPTRRPFTERGKRVGRLKVLIAGPASVGKTSLIRTMVQACEDIVHVDPINNPLPPPKAKDHLAAYPKTTAISETSASTKSYPSWWSELEQGRGMRRRKSMGESVLERNICFIDTPGWERSGPSDEDNMIEAIEAVVEHVEAALRRNVAVSELGDSELLGVLSGGGGFQVDVLLYMFHPTCHGINPAEADILRRLSSLTNVIPVIGKADTCTDDHLRDAKTAIKTGLEAAGVSTFAFHSSDFDPTAITHLPNDALSPFAISSALGDDTDTMDASILMSSEYVQPLVPSDLSRLVQQLFDPDNVQWLRHSALKKFLKWRREHLGNSLDLHKRELRELAISRLGHLHDDEHDTAPSSACSVFSSPSGVLVPYPSSSTRRGSSPGPFTRNMGTASQFDFGRHFDLDKVQRASGQVPGWAHDLKLALDAEHRERTRPTLNTGQDANGHGDVGDESSALVKRGHGRFKSRQGDTSGPTKSLDPNDPLGLLALGQQLNKRARTLLRIAGGCGAAATMLIWVLGNWGSVMETLGLGTSDIQSPSCASAPARDESRTPLDSLKAIFPGEKW